ncbi:hypothetical protein NMY22_g10630 [Coprinellus aureogranulatus]|nr:hypothetical protein NMY22_g10630 [Coprinellus aureogranulatus]
MGRRKLYHTDEERRAASRERSQRYYERKRETILQAKRTKYDAKRALEATSPRLAPLPPTEEERKLKNRQKSQRYWQRKKSVIKRRRKSHRTSTTDTSSSKASSQKRQLERTIWDHHLSYFWGELAKLLLHKDIRAFVEDVAARYLREGLKSSFEQAYKPFKHLDRRIRNVQTDIAHNLGAGAHLTETMDLSTQVEGVIELLEDLEELAVGEGRAGFMEKYTNLDLLYQRRAMPYRYRSSDPPAVEITFRDRGTIPFRSHEEYMLYIWCAVEVEKRKEQARKAALVQEQEVSAPETGAPSSVAPWKEIRWILLSAKVLQVLNPATCTRSPLRKERRRIVLMFEGLPRAKFVPPTIRNSGECGLLTAVVRDDSVSEVGKGELWTANFEKVHGLEH